MTCGMGQKQRDVSSKIGYKIVASLLGLAHSLALPLFVSLALPLFVSLALVAARCQVTGSPIGRPTGQGTEASGQQPLHI